jgi:nucleotide-binding universal stress UspA family protein
VRRWNAHLTVLYVVHDIWKDPLSTRMSADAFVRLRLLEKDRMRNLEDLECEFAVEFGPVEDRILEFAEKRASQLIVMDVPSTMHPALAAHMPGPLAYNVASHARCPVLGIRSISEQSPQEKINP